MVKSAPVSASELITQADAAKLRGVSLAAINELVRRGRLESFPMFGKTLVKRKDVLAFEPMKTGPKKGAAKKRRKRSR